MPDGNHPAPPATNTRGSHWPAFSKYVALLDGLRVHPCPFCADTKDGGNLLEYVLESCEPPLYYRYQCAHCCTEGPTKESPREAMEAWNSRVALTLDDLPRLTDDDREALDSGYVALEGVPSSGDDTPSLALRVELDDLMDFSRGPLAEAQALADVLEVVATDEIETRDCTQAILTRMLCERLADVRKSVDRALTLHLRVERTASESEVAP